MLVLVTCSVLACDDTHVCMMLIICDDAGGEPETADASPASPDPDDAADGAVAAGRVRLLPPPPHAQLALDHPPQGAASGAAAATAAGPPLAPSISSQLMNQGARMRPCTRL